MIERTKNFLTSTAQAQWSSDDPFGREIYNYILFVYRSLNEIYNLKGLTREQQNLIKKTNPLMGNFSSSYPSLFCCSFFLSWILFLLMFEPDVNIILQNTRPISIKLGTKPPRLKGIQFVHRKGLPLSLSIYIYTHTHTHTLTKIILLYREGYTN